MKKLEVPEGTNLIINDTSISDEVVCSAFLSTANLAKVNFQVLSANNMTDEIVQAFSSTDSNNVAVLYPGEGSKPIRRAANNDGYTVNTERQFSGARATNLSIKIPRELIDAIQQKKIKRVQIRDDVVATGLTIQTIREELLSRCSVVDYTDYRQDVRFSYPKVSAPKIDWEVVCWLVQKSADTTGFAVTAAIEYFRKSGRVPLNSLSTLLAETQKGKIVKENYANKYFPNCLVLYRLIEELKKYE